MKIQERLESLWSYGTFSPVYFFYEDWGISFRDALSAKEGLEALKVLKPAIIQFLQEKILEERINPAKYIKKLKEEGTSFSARALKEVRRDFLHYVAFLNILIEGLGGEPLELPLLPEEELKFQELLREELKREGRLYD